MPMMTNNDRQTSNNPQLSLTSSGDNNEDSSKEGKFLLSPVSTSAGAMAGATATTTTTMTMEGEGGGRVGVHGSMMRYCRMIHASGPRGPQVHRSTGLQVHGPFGQRTGRPQNPWDSSAECDCCCHSAEESHGFLTAHRASAVSMHSPPPPHQPQRRRRCPQTRQARQQWRRRRRQRG